MQIAIIQLPGASCPQNILIAVQRADMLPVTFTWEEAAEKARGFDGYILCGDSASYDRVLLKSDPVVVHLLKKENQEGRPILGFGVGACLLVDAGLVPGLTNDQVGLSLADDLVDSGGETIQLSERYQLNAFTRKLTTHIILPTSLPCMQKRFRIPPALWKEMQNNGQDVFYFEKGSKSVAAISNKAGNVLAMIPYLDSTMQSDAIFESMRDYIQDGKVIPVTPMYYQPR